MLWRLRRGCANGVPMNRKNMIVSALCGLVFWPLGGCMVQFVDGPACGNGRFDSGEACDDGNSLDGDGCSAGCVIEAGWICEGQPSDCRPICGDGVMTGGEVCDGRNLAGQTCGSLGLGEGELACRQDCSGLDASGCSGALCGDGLVSGEEVCDGTEVGGRTCGDFGFTRGTLVCADDCLDFDTSNCHSDICGDNRISGEEVCDGEDLGGRTCADFGFDYGALWCREDCSGYDTSHCTDSGGCGDGIVDPGEDCDSGGLDTADCDSDCTVSECGDGHVNAVAGEQCEGDFSSGCSDDCRFSEARINEARDGWQELPKVAVAEDGHFVVAWRSSGSAIAPFDIYARLFDAQGRPLGPAFQVNDAETFSTYAHLAVAMAPDGAFAVAWEQADTQSDFSHVAIQRYDIQGNPTGARVLSEVSWSPAMGMEESGRLVVAWVTRDSDYSMVKTGAFDESANLLGSVALVDSDDKINLVRECDLAMNRSGALVVAWSRMYGAETDTDIDARVYDSFGDPVGNTFHVDTVDGNRYPLVGMADDGDFVVLWTHYPIDATVPSSHRARVFSRSGQPVTQEFDAAPGLNALGDAALAVFSDGRFGLAITGWSNGEFHLQTYAAQATTPSTTSSVSAVPASPDHFFSDADMAARRDGSYVVVWAWDDDSGFRNDCYVRLFDDQGLPIGPVRP